MKIIPHINAPFAPPGISISEAKRITLIDLPVFPKGVLSLSLAVVADCFLQLNPRNSVRVIDLNQEQPEDYEKALSAAPAEIFGFKVSSQSLPFAVELTAFLRRQFPDALVLWGGEYPSLCPEESSRFAHSAFQGEFELSAPAFWRDLHTGKVKPVYQRDSEAGQLQPRARLELLPAHQHWHFMGHPFELTKGCNHKCTFCMVHVMQPEIGKANGLDSIESLPPGTFLNVLDYNLAVSPEGLENFCMRMEKTPAVQGWMGEMCLESLADKALLRALAASRMKIVYCGLESISETGLRSVNKTQNEVGGYEKIIASAQRAGIEVAGGLILGLAGATDESVMATVREFERLGLIYMKITFLTFNPGTKVKESMKRKGSYVTEEHSHFDGLRPTFLFSGQSAPEHLRQAKLAIRRFYSWRSLLRRSAHLRNAPMKRLFFISFSYCYGLAYRKWLQFGILEPEQSRMKEMLQQKFSKGIRGRCADFLVKATRALTGMAVVAALAGQASAAPPPWADSQLSREARLKSCAGCHQQIYDSWAEGPHSHFHVAPALKKTFMEGPYLCLKCHNAENLMDKAGQLNLTAPAHEAVKKMWLSQLPDPQKRNTGTDCITCHVSGSRVFTSPGFVPSPPGSKQGMNSPAFCKPEASKAFSPVYSCVYCHIETTDGYADYLKASKPGQGKSCIACHADSKKGDGNHYFFWGNDWEQPGRHSARLKKMNIFRNIIVKKSGSDGKTFVTFSWRNDFAGHDLFSDSPKQYIFRLSSVSTSGKKKPFPELRLVSGNDRHAPSKAAARNPGIPFSLKLQGEYYHVFELAEGDEPPRAVEMEVFYKRNMTEEDSGAIKIFEKKFKL